MSYLDDAINVLHQQQEEEIMWQYKYRELSNMLSLTITNRNQYELALMGASKEIVEANNITAERYRVSLTHPLCSIGRRLLR